MPTKNTGVVFATPEAAALAVACLFIYQQVKVSCLSTHTKNCPEDNTTELRDEKKNTILKLKEKHLVRRIQSLVKEIPSEPSNQLLVEHIIKKINSGDVCKKDDQCLLVDILLDFAEARYIRPWKINDDQDSLIDAAGKVFLTLPDPRAGLTTHHLEEFLFFRQKEEGVVPSSSSYENTFF